jgi:hypothetical protein
LTNRSYVLLLTVIFFLLLVEFVFVSNIVLFDKFLRYIENMKYMGTISNQPEGLCNQRAEFVQRKIC